MYRLPGNGRDGGRLRHARRSTEHGEQGEKNRDDHDVIYVMMGVSIVRKIDRTVCRGRTVKTTTTVCLPGDRVDDVRKWVGQVEGPGGWRGGGGGGGRFVGTTKACW